MRVCVRRSFRSACALAAVVTLLVTSACTSDDKGDEDTPRVDLKALGEPQQATDTPVKIGLVSDGGVAGSTSDPGRDLTVASVTYLNEYRNGLNGHPIELVECLTGLTPSGGTACGAQMVDAEVAAVLVPVSGTDSTVFEPIKGSGIPYITYSTVTDTVLTDPNSFVLTSSLAGFDAMVAIAKENDVDSIGIPVIDVPAATGPVRAIAEPIIDAAGLGLVYTPIAATVADMTPQIVQMLGEGAGMFVPVGTDPFIASALKALQQNAFDGPIMLSASPVPDDLIAAVPGGVEGMYNVVTITEDPEDSDVQLVNAIGEKYSVDVTANAVTKGFTLVLGLGAVLEGVEGDIDAEAVSTALTTMPEPLPLPVGGGITFQCGQGTNEGLPAVCSREILRGVLDADGNPQDLEVVGGD